MGMLKVTAREDMIGEPQSGDDEKLGVQSSLEEREAFSSRKEASMGLAFGVVGRYRSPILSSLTSTSWIIS